MNFEKAITPSNIRLHMGELTANELRVAQAAMRLAYSTIQTEIGEYKLLRDHIGGCLDGGCLIKTPKGMHTNGGCKCSTNNIKAQRMMYAGKRLCDNLSLADDVLDSN